MENAGLTQGVYRSDLVVNEGASAESCHQTITIPQVPEKSKVNFRFTSCGVKVKSGSGKANENKIVSVDDGWRSILHDVSKEVFSGSLLAIMGPSGSGKSTLLCMLTQTPNNTKGSGNVTLNGHTVDSEILRRYCAFMPQDDHLWPFLTCRETLSFAADFFLSKSYAERTAEVDRLIRELGLEKCANTLCGNQFLKGLSGGQKRRLSLAISLIKRPVVLFLDEPTSGLDSASAASIVTFLKQYAQNEDVAVICTIHQPSTAIFQQFDDTMLLSGGRVAYSGPTSDVTRYFREEVGAVAPLEYSPAEFVLESINSDFGDEQKRQEVLRILDAWSARSGPGGPACLPAESARDSLPDRSSLTTSLPRQVRHTLTSWVPVHGCPHTVAYCETMCMHAAPCTPAPAHCRFTTFQNLTPLPPAREAGVGPAPAPGAALVARPHPLRQQGGHLPRRVHFLRVSCAGVGRGALVITSPESRASAGHQDSQRRTRGVRGWMHLQVNCGLGCSIAKSPYRRNARPTGPMSWPVPGRAGPGRAGRSRAIR